MDNTLKEIKWEINENTTIPGRIGNNVFQNKYCNRYPSKDLMVPLLSGNLSVNLLNPYRKFGEMLREKGLDKVLEKVLESKGHCVICSNLDTELVSLNCCYIPNNYGCQNCLYFKENLRGILNLGGEGMFKRIHKRLERLEVFKWKEMKERF